MIGVQQLPGLSEGYKALFKGLLAPETTHFHACDASRSKSLKPLEPRPFTSDLFKGNTIRFLYKQVSNGY